MLLDRRILAVEGDGVEVEVERRPPAQPQATDRVEPVAHQLRVAGRGDTATVFGQERPLRDHVQAGEEGQPLVEDGAHHVAVACVAEELQGQQRPHGARGRDHPRSGEVAASRQRVQVGRDQVRQEHEQAAEPGVDRSRRQIESADIRHLGHEGAGSIGPLVVAAPRQLGEPLLLQDRGDGGRAERLAVVGQGAADVVDGQVLFPKRDDALPQPFLLAGGPALACGGEEEFPLRARAELVDEDAETPRRVAEARRRLGRGDTVDEEGAEGFVLTVSGVGGLEEPARQS